LQTADRLVSCPLHLNEAATPERSRDRRGQETCDDRSDHSRLRTRRRRSDWNPVQAADAPAGDRCSSERHRAHAGAQVHEEALAPGGRVEEIAFRVDVERGQAHDVSGAVERFDRDRRRCRGRRSRDCRREGDVADARIECAAQRATWRGRVLQRGHEHTGRGPWRDEGIVPAEMDMSLVVVMIGRSGVRRTRGRRRSSSRQARRE
jgi:hypothetical protein